MDNIDYGGLPSLLSSVPNLISLEFNNTRPTCCVSPEVIHVTVGALAGMTKLRDLCIKSATWFPKDQCRDEKKWQSPHSPSLVRAIFPALIKFQFKGDREYLADLMAPIDAPRLEDLSIKYPKPHENYEEEKTKAGNLSQFISRTESFKHAQFRCAELTFDGGITYAKTDLPQGECQQALLSLLVFDVGVPSIKAEDERGYESTLESADLGVAWRLLWMCFMYLESRKGNA